MIEKIAELVRDKKIDGITDLRDETSLRTGLESLLMYVKMPMRA